MSELLLRQNSDIDRAQWKELLTVSDFASPFQTPEFFDFFNSVDGFHADVFAIEENHVYLALVVVTIQQERGLKSFFSKRGIIYGGPLLNNDNDSLKFLLDSVRTHYSGIIYFETRNFFSYERSLSDFDSAGWSFQPWLNIKNVIQNKNLDDILTQCKYNRKREIRQSLAEGASWSEINTESGVAKVYEILSSLYKTRIKKPLPALDFIVKFWQSGIMRAFSVEHAGKIIGGSFCPVFPGKAIYTMYYCGIRNYHPRIFPTHLAILAAFEHGIQAGCRYLDFMGAGKPGKEYGVKKYKMEFGGNLVEEGRFLFVKKPFLYRIGKLGMKILSNVNS